MFKLSPKEWTDLNPSAPSFTPRGHQNTTQDIPKEGQSGGGSEETRNQRSKTFTGGVNEKKIGRRKAELKTGFGRPPDLTLEQIIAEKLKIDNKSRKENQKTTTTTTSHSKKAQTQETPHNLLDSSAPTRKRGKERETPKPKKPTVLKRIINKEKGCSDGSHPTSNDQSFRASDGSHDLEAINKRVLHTKAFRDYCCQRLTKSIDELVVNMLSDLVLFQDRMFLKDPIKAKMKRRLTFGLNEVTKYCKINKIKLLIIAPDIEKIESKGGLDDSLNNLMTTTQNNSIPIVFALNRNKLAHICKKKGSVSAIGVLNYDGSHENYKQLVNLCQIERNEYKTTFEDSLNKLKLLSEKQMDDMLLNLPNIPKEFCHLRDTLNSSDRQLVTYKKKLQ